MLRSLWNIFVVWPLRLTWRFILWLYDLFQKHVWPWMQNTVWPWYKGQSRRTQIIVGCVTGVLLISCCAFGAANSSNTMDSTAINQQVQQPNTSTQPPADTSTIDATTTPDATSQPVATATHAPTPVATQPVSHPPTATTPPAPKYPAINGNPYDYTLVNTGHLIYNPAADICRWLNCIASFWHSTNGYVDLCNDGTYSHSGGVQGACSKHGYEKQPVYQP